MTMILDGTNGETFPTWTTSTRPASPSVAQVGWNTTIGSLENYNGSAWTAVGGGGAGQWQSVQASNFAAVAGNAYAINTTSSAVTVTLPASPTAGAYIQLVDYAGTWSTNAVTLNPNGLKINASTSNVVLATSRQGVAIVYIDATQGWICYSQGSTIGPYPITYLTVAGGGGAGGTDTVAGGGGWLGGGGGAGGLIYSTTTASPGTAYTITIGAGGAAGTSSASPTNGSAGSGSSAFSSITTAGGYGGRGLGTGTGGAGAAGGSGGGGGGSGSGSVTSGGAGTSGQGNSGGNGGTVGSGNAGSGGGAGGAGNSGTGGTLAGGLGSSYSISGSSVTYATGGFVNLAGASNAAANTGNGGSGGQNYTSNNGFAGGSGIVIISYSGAQRGTGGTVTSSGGNTIHTFTSSGTYTA